VESEKNLFSEGKWEKSDKNYQLTKNKLVIKHVNIVSKKELRT
jgi:hypothetical protein